MSSFMKSRGLAMGVTAAAVVQKAAVASPIAIQAAGRIFAEPARNKKQTMRYVLPSKPDVPAHRSGSVASMRTTRTNLKPVGVRVGPSRRAIEDDTLDFLTVAASTAKALELNDSGYALSKQTTLELARSIVVFKLCSKPLVVKHSRKLYDLASRVLGERLPDFVVGKTFFSHFCGGVSSAELAPVIGRLRENGIGAILDYAAEADVSEAGSASHASALSVDEASDHNAATILGAIEACASTRASAEEDTFAAVKVTGLGEPELLEKVSGVIDAFNRVNELSADPIPDAQIQAALSAHEWAAYTRTRARLERIAAVAELKGVKLLVDAEQTYMQRAIDHLTLHTMRLHNTARPIVFNTYQCYLRDAPRRLAKDLLRADREGFILAAKVVRGAYMVQERALAARRGYSDPIHADIASTHKCYDDVVASLIHRKAQGFAELAADSDVDRGCASRRAASAVMVACHNEGSVQAAAALMAELGLNKAQGGVFFAQLKGMCDHISFGLGARGFRVYKYVPYGPVREVMPYLLRRAEENADIMRGANKEVHVLGRELRRRLATSVFGEQPSFVRDNIVVGHRVMGPRMVGQAA